MPKARSYARYKRTGLDYLATFYAQGRKCATCEYRPPAGTRLFWDHDHACCPGRQTCGKCTRGLVCNRCNLIIGGIENATPEHWAYLGLDVPQFQN